MKKKNLIILGLVVGVIFAVICIVFILMDKNIKLGYAGNKTSSSMTASFQYFDGQENKKINLEKNETIFVSYELESSKGELALNILGSDNNILASNDANKGTMEFKAETEQKYTIQIIATKAKGSYRVSWEKNKE